ncbi:hypothetical protein MRB53_032093 [Persea americana]|uniref:Uncharacterized protein n=1 Tax=Persea americana TaxID=3435 RepID=A0ACC2KRD7_PERAE|nr:hypothetical protein MRB53_032093 [Persea americana]
MKRKDGLPTADAKSSRSFENIYPVFISESSAVSRAVTTLSRRGAGKKGGRHHRVRDRGVAGPGALDEEKKSNRFIRRFKRLEDVAGETTPHFRLPLKTFVSLQRLSFPSKVQTQHLRHCADRSSLSSPKLDAGKPNDSGSSSSWIRQWS